MSPLYLFFFACGDAEVKPATDTGNVVQDYDGDGFTIDEDCDDQSEAVNPAAIELCDGIDNDCNGEIDDGVTDTFYGDSDGDGFGNPDLSTEACEAPSGFVNIGTDCDDTDPQSYPGAEELCDDSDNDCDGDIDDGVQNTYYYDGDNDGFGDESNAVEACEAPEGYIENGGDCSDAESFANPNMFEICDGIDNNCDGNIDESGASGESTHYTDSDGDGFGDDATETTSCTIPTGSVLQGGDCDDDDATANPATVEICDGVDNNCDGDTDENTAVDVTTWYLDDDEDGYGNENAVTVACNAPSGYVAIGDDCDDANVAINPGAEEECDTLDNDCDGSIDESDAIDQSVYFMDADGDGYGSFSDTEIACEAPQGYVDNADDCDDTADAVYLNAPDICDGLDNDCDGDIDNDLSYFALDASCPAEDCLDVLLNNPAATDGSYWVDPDGLGVYEVYCDQSTDGGGWNLISVVRNDDGSQVIVADNYCNSIDTVANCKGRMPSSVAATADEVLVYDLGSDDFIVYENFESNGAFGYFTLNKELQDDNTCTGFGHVCGSAIDGNLSIATTSGYTYNYTAPLLQWWRAGGWWIGAAPNSGNSGGRVHATSYFTTHDLRNRSSASGSTGEQSAGHQAVYYR